MRILGIDPGLNCTGYGIVDHVDQGTALVEGGIVRTAASAPLEVRLATISERVRSIMREFSPDVMVVEQIYSKYSHPQTAILMGHARGVVLAAAAERGVTVTSYEASLVKRALTGRGRASKEQVGAMVAHRLGLREPPEPFDVTDALALCLCHAAPQRHQGRHGPLPEAVARALAAQGGKRG